MLWIWKRAENEKRKSKESGEIHCNTEKYQFEKELKMKTEYQKKSVKDKEKEVKWIKWKTVRHKKEKSKT